jgi:hypothetical protein
MPVIHYHGTPLGGKREDVGKFFAGRHALIPWQRPEDLGVCLEVCQTVIADNSAFSAWKSGKPIADWGPYYDWIRSFCRHPAFRWAIIPDVIDGNESANNVLLNQWPRDLKNYGVPVWHLHESLDRLKFLADCYPVVCLGSSGQWATVGTRGWHARMGEAMSAICDAGGLPCCKLHGLRMLDPAIFHSYPLASADSTNVAQNGGNMNRKYAVPSVVQQREIVASRIEAHNSGRFKPDGQRLMWLGED